MGQKVHPYGFRLGFNKTWISNWYARKDYSSQLVEDISLRKYIFKTLSHAGISSPFKEVTHIAQPSVMTVGYPG